MKSPISRLGLFFDGIVPLIVSVAVWSFAIVMTIRFDWADSQNRHAWFVIIALYILFLFSIYPLAVFVKFLLYDYHTLIDYDESSNVVSYERKGLKVRFHLSEVKSFVRINPRGKSAMGYLYEIELTSGCVISITDLLAVTRKLEKTLPIDKDLYESVLFRSFYNHPPQNEKVE